MDSIDKILKPGTKIELSPNDIPKGEDAEEIKFYKSKVSDVREDGTIETTMPTEQGRLVLFSVGSELEIYCYTERAVYECRVAVQERYKHEGLYFLLLRPVGELRKKQRREYYRYKCTLPMRDRLVDIEERKKMAERGQLVVRERRRMDRSTIIDISGGGMQFMGAHKYEKGSLIFCEFSFGKPREAFAQILDSAGIADRPGEYRHRAKFFGMNKKEREEIIRHIFALERMKRKHDVNGSDDVQK